MKEEVLKRGDVLFVKGEMSSRVYLIKEGELALFNEKEKNLLPVRKINAKELFGETELFVKKVHEFTGVVLSPTLTLSTVSHDEIKEALKRCDSWVVDLLNVLSNRFAETEDVLKKHQIIDEDETHRFSLVLEERNFFWQNIIDYRKQKSLL